MQRSRVTTVRCSSTSALFNPVTSILIQKRLFYSGNLNSETPWESKNVFLHWGDVLGMPKDWQHVAYAIQQNCAEGCCDACRPDSLTDRMWSGAEDRNCCGIQAKLVTLLWCSRAL